MSQITKPRNPGTLDRRSFLKLCGGGLVALVGARYLSACSPSPTAAPTVAQATVPPAAAVKAIGGKIDFMGWEGYDLPTCMESWQKENGEVVISPSYIGDQAEIQAKLTTGNSAGYDLISYYHGAADLYIDDLKLVQPLDLAQIPNFQDLYPWFRTGEFWARNGAVWGVPFTWGAEGCCYRADKIEPIQSWMDLLKPEFTGLVGLVDDSYGMVLMGGIAVGLADLLPNLPPKEFEEVKAFLLELKTGAWHCSQLWRPVQYAHLRRDCGCIPWMGSIERMGSSQRRRCQDERAEGGWFCLHRCLCCSAWIRQSRNNIGLDQRGADP